MTNPIIISIEGNIGAGKTTLLNKLEDRFRKSNLKIVVVREPVDIWESIADSKGENILQKFYSEPYDHAFAFQVMAFSTCLSLLRSTIASNPDCDAIICERSPDANKHIFAKLLYNDGMISEIEYKIYNLFIKEHANEFTLDGVVYIDVAPEVCHQRISKRGRDGEEHINLEYLNKCKKSHDDWLYADGMQVLRIDCSADVTYDKSIPKDKGIMWLNLIEEMISKQINDRKELQSCVFV